MTVGAVVLIDFVDPDRRILVILDQRTARARGRTTIVMLRADEQIPVLVEIRGIEPDEDDPIS
jgi:hypothetical protein